MICRCFGKTLDFALVRQTAHAMLGVPDYDAYVAHFARSHPERQALDREEFFPGAAGGAVWLGSTVLLMQARPFFSEETNQKTSEF